MLRELNANKANIVTPFAAAVGPGSKSERTFRGHPQSLLGVWF